MTTIAGTGHRPPKLGGYSDEVFNKCVQLASIHLEGIIDRPTIISGMALGWDQALAQAAIDLVLPLHTYVPHYDQDERWPSSSRVRYQEILSHTSKIVYAYEGPYPGAWCLHKRNQMMVDACDSLLALWDGSSGGTKNCLDYARKKGKPYINLWDRFSGNTPTKSLIV